MSKNWKEADEWMWSYCIYLGGFSFDEFVYDLGVYVNPWNGAVSHAVVYGPEDGDYFSGYVSHIPQGNVGQENLNRWITFQLDNI